jgi:hypothetical protein
VHHSNESVIIRDVRQQFYSCFSKPKTDRTAKGLLALPRDKTAAAAGHTVGYQLFWSGRDGDWTLFVSPKLKSEEKSYWTADYTISIILTELRWRDLDSHLSIDSFIEMCKEK